jgi:adenine-specific DNA-methyltransferase
MADTATINDRKFEDLKAKLRELFELDKSDLDFGIYRIMSAKNKEVSQFLDRQLKDVVRDILKAHGAGAAEQIEAEIEKARAGATDAGINPNDAPRVKELQSKLASAGGATAAELEADIYNHLLAFFSRYYDEGDFISKRRYKGDTYAIPYNGEEVTLYWANKDQYYIKSGEWHKDYRFKVGGKTVRFKLVAATQEKNANREPEESKRRYILTEETPVLSNENLLILRFEFRLPTDAEKQRAAGGGVAIFGGEFANRNGKGKKGDEREQFCADAETHARAAMSEEWQQIVSAAAPTNAMPDRTVLGKYLDHFTARNTLDFFIHKDLGGFLHRELDFYIKNELLRIDDFDSLAADHAQRIQGKLKAIRSVAARIIDFLAAIENFQKKMWLKKKFVLNANWLVTIDRVPPTLRDIVAGKKEQWKEWEDLGFRPEIDASGLFDGAAWGTRAYLDANPGLIVDTRFFGNPFTAELLSSNEVLGPTGGSHENATMGLLIHSENFQAVNLLGTRFREQIKCIYIDPPYNTSENSFLYKNSYRHSSWLSMVANGIDISRGLTTDNGACLGAIDDTEYSNFKALLARAYGSRNYVATIAVQVNPAGQNIRPNVPARSHDYFHVFAKNIDQVEMRLRELTKKEKATYTERDKDGKYYWDNLRRRGGNSRPINRRRQWFPLFVLGTNVRVPKLEWDDTERKWILKEKPGDGEEVVWPIDPKGIRRIWRDDPLGAIRDIAVGAITVIEKAGRTDASNFLYFVGTGQDFCEKTGVQGGCLAFASDAAFRGVSFE